MKHKIFAMFLSALQHDTTLENTGLSSPKYQNSKKKRNDLCLQSVVFALYAVLRSKPYNLNSVESKNSGLLQTQLSLICSKVILFKIAIGNRIYLYCFNRLQDECLRANNVVLIHQGCRNPCALSLQKVFFVDPKATTAPALALKHNTGKRRLNNMQLFHSKGNLIPLVFGQSLLIQLRPYLNL